MKYVSLAWMVSVAACQPPGPTNPVRIGIMLPYTGSASAIGFNEERASLMLAQELNEQRGGVGGRPIELLFGDSGGSPTHAAAVTRSFVEQGVVAIIGPGDDDEITAVTAEMAGSGIPLVSPTTAEVPEGLAYEAWFRLSPPALEQGKALANVVNQTVHSVLLIHATDPFHANMAGAFASRFDTFNHCDPADPACEDLGVVREVAVGDSLVDALQAARDVSGQVQGYVLLLDALTAARFISEATPLLGSSPQWFLGPRAKSDILIWNTRPQDIDGVIGIAPFVAPPGSHGADFASSFIDSWDGEPPFDATYFVYDATWAVLVAIDRALRLPPDARTAAGKPVGGGNITQALFAVFLAGGLQETWSALAEATDINEADAALAASSSLVNGLQYTGVTGSFVFCVPQPCFQRTSIPTRVWTVHDGAISTQN